MMYVCVCVLYKHKMAIKKKKNNDGEYMQGQNAIGIVCMYQSELVYFLLYMFLMATELMSIRFSIYQLSWDANLVHQNVLLDLDIWQTSWDRM